MKNLTHITIIGAGLSGLTLAYLLEKENVSTTILEASDRSGGRIQTILGNNNTPLELGATWFSDQHKDLLNLIDDLGLKKYIQFTKGKSLIQTSSKHPPETFIVPSGESVSYRIANGTQQLTDTLIKRINNSRVIFNKRVVSILEKNNELELTTAEGETIKTNKVVLTLPPQLVSTSISFSPSLEDKLTALLPNVQTWMAGSIKFVLEYKEAFWRNEGFSGMLFSQSGIVTEMYDHTNIEENKFGFTGFLHPSANQYKFESRKQFVLTQITELLGKDASVPLYYQDKIWTGENILGSNEVIHFPHQNNGHSLLQKSFMNGKLYFSSTECSTEYAGYMEGAIRSAKKTFVKIIS